MPTALSAPVSNVPPNPPNHTISNPTPDSRSRIIPTLRISSRFRLLEERLETALKLVALAGERPATHAISAKCRIVPVELLRSLTQMRRD